MLLKADINAVSFAVPSAKPPKTGRHSYRSIARKMDDPVESGSTKSSMTMLFSRTVRNLPVDLTEFVKMSKLSPDVLFTEQTMDRLVQVILAEQDTRISNKVCFYRSLRWCCLYLWGALDVRSPPNCKSSTSFAPSQVSIVTTAAHCALCSKTVRVGLTMTLIPSYAKGR
jgi:hypothetical protein